MYNLNIISLFTVIIILLIKWFKFFNFTTRKLYKKNIHICIKNIYLSYILSPALFYDLIKNSEFQTKTI